MRPSWFVGLAMLAAAPFLGIYPVFVMKALCFAMFACAFNLLLGYSGLLSFGHAAFFGVAGYATGWLTRTVGWPPELSIVASMAFSAVLGLCVGAIAIKREGIYFAMITLALAQMVYFSCLQAPFTGGEDGLQAIPRGSLLGLISLENDLVMYYVVLAVFCAVWLFIARVISSPFGHVLKAVRGSEHRAVSLGHDAARHKLTVFVISAALSGLAGAMKAIVLGFTTLTDVHWTMSGEVVLMTLLGGVGTLFGPVVGAFAVVGLQTYLADRVGSWVMVIIGGTFVLCVLIFRDGVIGQWSAWRGRRAQSS